MIEIPRIELEKVEQVDFQNTKEDLTTARALITLNPVENKADVEMTWFEQLA